MPGFDGTGPAGKGPFTGRGMGYCVMRLDPKDSENTMSKGRGVFDMPRGDGTGPMGLGPMTGRAAGFCAGYNVPGYMNPVPGRGRGFGFGRGFGRGRGWGRGFGRGFGFGWAGYPYVYGNPYAAPAYPANFTSEQEADMLRAEAKAMQDEIDAINSRLKDLESRETRESDE